MITLIERDNIMHDYYLQLIDHIIKSVAFSFIITSDGNKNYKHCSLDNENGIRFNCCSSKQVPLYSVNICKAKKHLPRTRIFTYTDFNSVR